jgi:hypothetical protein
MAPEQTRFSEGCATPLSDQDTETDRRLACHPNPPITKEPGDPARTRAQAHEKDAWIIEQTGNT